MCSRCQRLLWLKSISAAPDDGRQKERKEREKTLPTFILAHTANLLQSVELKKEKRLHKKLEKLKGGEKKPALALLLHSMCKINFLPPQTGCPQHAHTTTAERCKNTKHISVRKTSLKPTERLQAGTPTGHCVFGFQAKKGMNYASQKHLNQKKTGKNIHIFDVN